MDFPFLLKLLAGPVLGAVIGIFTNYIAVKMLFRPLNEVKIGKFRLPFTPGIMPRRKPMLAKALGRACSESLIREEDLKRTLLSDSFCTALSSSVLSLPSIKESGCSLFGEEKYEQKRELVLDYLSNKITDAVRTMDLAELIKQAAPDLIAAIAGKNPLIGMFVNDHMVAQLAAPIGERVTEFLNGDGRGKLRNALEEEISVMEEKPVAEWVSDTESFERVIVGLYRRLVSKYAGSIASQFHIAEIVEEKVNAMPPEALEALMLSVMKKELNAVIWLGGIIGLLLGLVSVLMNFVNF